MHANLYKVLQLHAEAKAVGKVRRQNRWHLPERVTLNVTVASAARRCRRRQQEQEQEQEQEQQQQAAAPAAGCERWWASKHTSKSAAEKKTTSDKLTREWSIFCYFLFGQQRPGTRHRKKRYGRTDGHGLGVCVCVCLRVLCEPCGLRTLLGRARSNRARRP